MYPHYVVIPRQRGGPKRPMPGHEDTCIRRWEGKKGMVRLDLKYPSQPLERPKIQEITVTPPISKPESVDFCAEASGVYERAQVEPYLVRV